MRKTVVANLTSRFGAYAELIASVDEATLNERLQLPRNKTLGEHLWCVVGTRESFAKAIEAGEWQGWACSMTRYGTADYTAKLAESAEAVVAAVAGVDDWTEERDRRLATLCEHEVMHEGQIIRHMYAMEKDVPASFVWA